MKPTRVCIAGVTGWVGTLLAKEILRSPELALVGGIARRKSGTDIGTALGIPPLGIRITQTLDEALTEPADVLIDYTEPSSVKMRVLEALDRGLRVIIGTSGLQAKDYVDIELVATRRNLGVISAGNFSLTAALAKHFALFAARHLQSWEIIDYANAGKIDSPSGTTLELAEELESVRENRLVVPIDQTRGAWEARGARISGTQVHSIRLPSYVLGFETIFGAPDERLVIRHDAGNSAEPYVAGTILAVKKVTRVIGLVRGLDRLLFKE
jgi:4-hydroxy-tetrahydrodipicolinate reductase